MVQIQLTDKQSNYLQTAIGTLIGLVEMGFIVDKSKSKKETKNDLVQLSALLVDAYLTNEKGFK